MPAYLDLHTLERLCCGCPSLHEPPASRGRPPLVRAAAAVVQVATGCEHGLTLRDIPCHCQAMSSESFRVWPDVMDGNTAASYCNVTVQAINKAANEGKLTRAGRRGGVGAWTYRKVDLDAWLAMPPVGSAP